MSNTTVGIPTNPGLLWNAAALAGPKTYASASETGMYGSMVSCNEDDVLALDTGLIPAGTLSGLYNIRLYWDTAITDGTVCLYLAIYEDGVLLEGGELPIEAKSNSADVGTRVICNFQAGSQYQIQLWTATLSGTPVLMDYIRLDPLQSGVLLADELGLSSSRNEGIELVQKYTASVTNGTGTRECTQNLYFNREFAEPPTVLAMTDESTIVVSSIPYTTYAYVHYMHVDNTVWSGPIDVKFLVVGIVYPDPAIMEV